MKACLVFVLASTLIGACNDMDTQPPVDSPAVVDSSTLMSLMHDPTCIRGGKPRADGNAGTVGSFSDTVILNSLRADCRRRSSATGMAAKALMAVGQMMLSIPEYHDEQAFPISATEFGPVALFFASPMLGGFNHRWQIEEHGDRGMVAGILVVVDSSGGALPDPYVRLKLKAGVNCVWVAHPAGTWISYISQPKPDSACAETDKRDTLAVIPYQHSVFRDPAHYPPVVRFSEAGDPVTKLPRPVPGQGQPLLGVRCANYWCEIGPRDPNTGRPLFNLSRPGTDTTTMEGGIKGWHDEQWLAIAAANGVLQPGLRAIIIPARRIAERSAASFQGPTFVTSATIVLPNAPQAGSKYDQLGFRRGNNILAFRQQGGVWEAQLTSSGGVFKPNLFDRVQHFDAAVPGTARFRWNVMDDGAWAACGQACCRIAAIQ